VIVGKRAYPIDHIVDARCEHVRVWWLWPLPLQWFALDLAMDDARKIRVARRRDAYFIFQLVNAIQAAQEESQLQLEPLAVKSSA